jgi:hypothetical protein
MQEEVEIRSLNAPVAKPIPVATGTGFSMGPNSDTHTRTHGKTHAKPTGIPIPMICTRQAVASTVYNSATDTVEAVSTVDNRSGVVHEEHSDFRE